MTDRTTPEPGIYEDVPFETYCDWDAVNNSSLGPARKSMLHYKRTLDEPREDTSALSFGRLAHTGKLEPTLLLKRYVAIPDLTEGIRREGGGEYANVKATAEYKRRVADFKQLHADKEIVSDERLDQLVGIVTALDQSSRSREWFDADGPTEVSIAWDDPLTGLRCKARVDKWSPAERRATDLKTCADLARFTRSMHDYGYARQAAFYLDGLEVLTGQVHQFCIVAVESQSPFAVQSAPVSEDAVVAGRFEYRQALRAIAAARDSHEWTGYEDPHTWELPTWALPEVNLSVDGQTITL